MLSLVTIARDEAHRWSRFVDGVSRLRGVLPELETILVVDSRTTDDTAELAAADGWAVYPARSTKLGEMKEFGRQQAKGIWVLNLDVDEIPTIDACTSIHLAMLRGVTHAYTLDIRTFIGSQPLRQGPLAAERRLRLFPRKSGHWPNSAVHEKVVTDLPLRPLRGIVLHHSFGTLREFEEKQLQYAATYRKEHASKPIPLRTLRAAFRGLRYLVLYGGLARGAFGWRVAWAESRYTWDKYTE